MKNSRGFTIVETLVAIALLGIVTSITAMIISESTKRLKDLETDIENATETEIAERMLMRDLKMSEPSFNNVIMRDDKNKDFYEFVSDAVDKIAVQNSARTFTLDVKGKSAFNMLIVDSAPGGAIFYDPVMAYLVGAEPADWAQASTLKFVSLNRNQYLQAQNPAYWIPGRILLLDTPIAIRGMSSNGPNYNVAPRSPSFIGVVPGGVAALKTITVPNFPGLFNTSHPLFPTKVISSEDVFLRSVPPAGGAAALVRLKAVRLVQYELIKTNIAGSNNLIRKEWNGEGAKWGDQVTVGTKISTAVFSRKATNDPLVYFQINRNN